jgi:transposase
MKIKTTQKAPGAITMREFLAQFSTDEVCLQHLFDARFGQGYICPKCERKSNWYRFKAARAFACQWCGYHLHPTVGTPFEGSRTPLQLWFYAIYLFINFGYGVSAKELERQLGVAPRTAVRMAEIIRRQMAQIDAGMPLFGGGFGSKEAVTANNSAIFSMMLRGARGEIKVSDQAESKALEPALVA